MDLETKKESFSEKVKLLIVDKIILGVVVALVVFLFSYYLQNQQLKADYQKQLFEKRVKAYEVLLDKSKLLVDELYVFYNFKGQPKGSLAQEALWEKRYSLVFDEPKIYIIPNNAVIKKFQELEDHRRMNSLYFSKEMENRLTAFGNLLWGDYNAKIQKTKQKKSINEDDDRAAYEKASAAYEDFRSFVIRSLSIDKMILG